MNYPHGSCCRIPLVVWIHKSSLFYLSRKFMQYQKQPHLRFTVPASFACGFLFFLPGVCCLLSMKFWRQYLVAYFLCSCLSARLFPIPVGPLVAFWHHTVPFFGQVPCFFSVVAWQCFILVVVFVTFVVFPYFITARQDFEKVQKRDVGETLPP